MPRAYNEIIPAWTLFANAYGLVRTERKFLDATTAAATSSTTRCCARTSCAWSRSPTTGWRAARDQGVYIDDDIEGLGKNFLREAARLQAIDYYGRAMKRYALRILLAEAEGHVEIPGSSELARELVRRADAAGHARAAPAPAGRDRAPERRAGPGQQGQRRPARRRIIPGYADAHVAAADDTIVRSAWERVEKTAPTRVRKLGIRSSRRSRPPVAPVPRRERSGPGQHPPPPAIVSPGSGVSLVMPVARYLIEHTDARGARTSPARCG